MLLDGWGRKFGHPGPFFLIQGKVLMDTFFHDLRYGCRLLLKNPGTAMVAVLLLAVGIGANAAVFSFINALFLKPLPFPNSNRLVHIYGQGPHGHYWSGVSYPEYERLRSQMKSVSDMAAEAHIAQLHLVGEQGIREIRGSFVTANYFSLIGVQPASGRFFLPEEDAVPGRNPVAVISYRLWQDYFLADTATVGREFTINNVPLKIIGIAPAGFSGDEPGLASDVWIPMAMRQAAGYGCKPAEECTDVDSMIAKLAPGYTVQQAQSEASAKIVWTSTDYPQTAHRAIGVFLAVGAHPETRLEFREQTKLLVGATGILLLVACANLAGLLLARSVTRRKEMSIRLSIGATGRRIVRQVLTENLLLALLGSALGLLLSFWGTRFLSHFYLMDSEGFLHLYDFSPDWRLLVYSVAVAGITGILFGLAPALHASRQDLVTELKDGAGSVGVHGGRRWRNLLVSAQVALSLVLVVCAALLTRSSQSLQAGANFDPAHVAVLRLRPELAKYDPSKMEQFARSAWQRFSEVAGVQSVTMMVGGEGEVWDWKSGHTPAVTLPGDTGSVRRFIPEIPVQDVDAHFFSTLKIPLLQGRAFTNNDAQNKPLVAIVNDTLARLFWPQDSAVGHTLIIGNAEYRIIGVCASIQPAGGIEPPGAKIYRSFWQAGPAGDLRFAVRVAGDPSAALPALRDAARKLDPNVPLGEDMALLDQLKADYTPVMVGRAVISFCGLLALLLSAIGLYSVLAFAVRTRTREIGVRIALGAQRADVMNLVLREALLVAISGIAGGLLAATAATGLLKAWLYGVQARDLISFAIASAALLITALIAAFLPAHHAAKVDPMVALRSE